MSLDPEDPLVRMATFGRIVEDFLAGPIGQYVEERAQKEELEAINKLRTVDAEDSRRVREYQNEAKVAGKVLEWLLEAVHHGHMALAQLKDDVDGN